MSQFNIRQHLIDELNISEELLNRLIVRSPHAYKQYKIPKKNGGYRIISQPSRGTKYLQYWLMQNIFTELHVHRSASAYQKGSSIKKNAEYHAKNSYIAKFDFKNFFHSIKGENLTAHLVNHFGDKLTEDELKDIVRISCIKLNGRDDLNLSIGAPSSPILSNSILYEFDCQVSEWCEENKIRYSRYADDLTFSTNISKATSSIEPYLKSVIRNINYLSLRFNRKKTTHLSKKHQRRVTGIILTNEGHISIGRSKKREISALIHKFTTHQLAEEDMSMLQGLIGFAKGIEPEFVNRMCDKYGKDVIFTILKYREKEE